MGLPEIPTANATPQEIYDRCYDIGLEMLRKGISYKEVEKLYQHRGIEPRMAAAVLVDIRAIRKKEIVAEGNRNVLWGAIWAICGATATVIGYFIASNEVNRKGGSSTYIMWTGPIVYGLIRFVRGLIQAGSGKN